MSTFENAARITPMLWFDANADEAVEFYLSVFRNSRRLGPPGMTIPFELDGQMFLALNGGPMFHFTEAVSFVVRCDTQQEVDEYWEKLSAGGSESRCGWLKDRFGLSWQIIPSRLPELIRHPKAFEAMLGMTKLDLAELERAADSVSSSS